MVFRNLLTCPKDLFPRIYIQRSTGLEIASLRSQ